MMMRSISLSVGKTIQRGFTLVELLIVVIILAILAAIVIPQFSGATLEAKEAALDSNLNAMRSAIELYRAQHDGKYPGALASTGATCGALTAGGGAVNTAQAVTEQLTQYSNLAGGTCNGVGAAQVTLGPYLRKGIPADPITNTSTLTVQTTGAPLAGSGSGGWAYDNQSGQIIMNSATNDSKGVAYNTH